MDLTEREPKVFVIQQQQRWDGQKLVPKFDLSPAHVFGELEYLLTPSAHAFNPEPIVQELRKKLISFSSDDFLLLIGNPVLIGLACAIVGARLRSFNVLQWNGREQRYIKIEIEL